MVNPGTLKPLAERFWRKVDKRANDCCWLWLGAKTKRGYGVIGKGRAVDGTILTHRVSYELHYGAIVDKTLYVCHKCDNPSCVNPHHLFLGTQSDNLKDCYAKGRHERPMYNSKLSEHDVRIILKSKASYLVLAKKFGVHHSTIISVRNRTTWKHVQ